MPAFAVKAEESDFYFVERNEPERIAETLVEMVKTRIPGKYDWHPIRDIQVLCPMNRGSLGIRELNVEHPAQLNPADPQQPTVEKFGWRFRINDKVIQTENNYDKEARGFSVSMKRLDYARFHETWNDSYQTRLPDPRPPPRPGNI